MIITDTKWERKGGDKVSGFYMDGYLAFNLQGIPNYLAKNWDLIGIISGHAEVGVGKSTMAGQVGLYCAWMLAGGSMNISRGKDGKWVYSIKAPTKEVHFSLEENVVFDAEQLQDASSRLYKKYGKGQVVMYDEGTQGMDSKRVMESINKTMEDFFSKVRIRGQIFLIVLPDYFKLSEHYATGRSTFLIDVYINNEYERGFFKFYNKLQKEKLYFFGKKVIGPTAKYNAATPNFYGKYTKFFPFDEEDYDKKKDESLDKTVRTRFDKKMRLQRDIFLHKLHKTYGMPLEEISDTLLKIANVNMGVKHLQNILSQVKSLEIASKGYDI